MVKYRTPRGDESSELFENHDCTVMVPDRDYELSEKQRNQLEAGTLREQSQSTHHPSENIQPIQNSNYSTDGGYIGWVTIDIESLWKLIYEHRRYSHAEGFSDSEMAVLRSIEFNSNDRVIFDDINKDRSYAGKYAESTIYKALGKLVDKNLVQKEGRGVYRYDGP